MGFECGLRRSPGFARHGFALRLFLPRQGLDPGVDRACDPQDNCDPQENKDRRYADEQRCQRTHGLDRDEAEHRHLEHDVFKRKHIMLLSCCYRMLFCEKPDSTFHSML